MLTTLSRFVLYGGSAYDMRKKPTVSSWAWGHTQNFLRRKIGLHEVSAPGFVDFAKHYVDKYVLEWLGVGSRSPLPRGWPADVFNTIDRLIRVRGGDVKVGDMLIPAFSLNRKSALALTSILIAYVDFNGDSADFAHVTRLESALEDAISRECKRDMNIRILSKPARIEIDRLDTPTLTLKSYWPKHIDGTVKAGHYLVGVESTPKGDALIHNRLHNSNEYSCVWFGASGSGKTQAMTSALLTLCATTSPDELSVIVIDPKGIDLPVDSLPHLACPIINDPVQARAAVLELGRLLAERAKSKDRDAARRRVLVVIDEMKYLLSQQAEDEELINTLSDIGAMGRAWGISMFVGSQRATNEFFPKRVHSQIPARWVGRVTDGNEATFASGEKSSDAHKLPGRGAGMLYEPDGIVRLQSTYIGDAKEDSYPQTVAPFVRDIVKRWGDAPPHWRLGDDARKDAPPEDVTADDNAPVDLSVLDNFSGEILTAWKQTHDDAPAAFTQKRLRDVHQEITGKRLNTAKEKLVFRAFLATVGRY